MLADLMLALHLLGAVLWVGGMGFALLVLRPSLAAVDPAQRMGLHREVFRRFFRLVWHVMPVMILTGYAMIFMVYGGFAGLAWNINAMNLIGLVMAGLFVAIAVGPWRRFRAADDAVALAQIRRLVTVNLALGLLSVVVAALR